MARRTIFGLPFDFFDEASVRDAWEEFDQLFSAFATDAQTFPPYNVYALKDGSMKIEVALAGYSQEDVTIRANDGKIIIESAEGKTKEEDADCQCARHGIRSSKFKIAIPVASKFDLSKTKATMKNGMLIILAPLAEERKPKDLKIDVE